MAEEEKIELDFYKNGSAESVLKRFVFTEDEEKLIKDAIRSAKMPHPRMVLIHKADELLKEIAKTREPVESTAKPNESAEAMLNLEMAKLKKATEKKDGKRYHSFTSPKQSLVV